MKTGIKLLKTATLVLAFLANAGALADDGEMSGEGRNGPDKSGVSIPVQVDKLMTTKQLEAAAKPCYVAQYKYLLEQMLRQKVELTNVGVKFQHGYTVIVKSANSEPLCVSFQANNSSLGGFLYFYVGRKGYDICGDIAAGTAHEVNSNVYKSILRFGLEAAFDGGISLKIDSQHVIDDLGSGIDDPIVKSYQVILSTEIMRVFYNAIGRQGFTTSLKMNNEEFKQCLENNINQLN